MLHLKTRIITAGAVALTLGLAAIPAKAQEFINVLTGGTSGVYYPLGVALSDIYGKGIEGARTQVQATKASVENLNLLQQGKGEIAFALGDSVKLAAEGNTEAGFPGKLDKLRGIAAIYPNYIQIVASPGIRHQDARRPQGQEPVGRRAGLRHRAQRARHLRRRRHELRGSRQGRIPALRRIGRADQEPPARRDAAVGRPRRRLDPRPRDVAADQRRRGARPRWSARSARPTVAATIPAGTYEGQTEDVATAAVGNFLVTHDGVSDETAYQMTKLLFENLDQLAAAHAAAKAIDPAKALDGMPVPLHPGAERYYQGRRAC